MRAEPLTTEALTLDAVMEPALIIMEGGGATEVADRALRNMLRAAAASEPTIIWRLDHLMLSAGQGLHTDTRVRSIAPVALNLRRAAAAISLAEQVARSGLTPALKEHIANIKRMPSTSRWLLAPAAALAGAALAKTMDGDWGAVATAALAGGVGQIVRSQLQHWRFSRTSTTLLCTFISGLLVAAALRLGFSQTLPAAVAGGVTYAVPGMLLINAYFDFTSEKFIFIGLQRLVHALFLFLLITLAVLAAEALVALI